MLEVFVFPFHYGSIETRTYQKEAKTSLAFPFHNGSIET